MEPTKTKVYSEESARRMLADATESDPQFIDQRREDALVLLQKFHDLAKEYGLAVNKTPNGSLMFGGSVMFGRGTMGIRVDDDGWPCSDTKSSAAKRLELHYDPATRRFEGTQEDPDVVPEPGKVRPRRSALAVLASEALAMLKGGK